MPFRHEVIDPNPPCGRLTSCQTADLTGNGRPDLITTGLGANPEIHPFGKRILPRKLPVVGTLLSHFETNLFWYENPGWERHALATERDLRLGVGSTLFDVDGDGRVDLIVGQGRGGSDVYWYEQPPDPRTPWRRHLLTDRFEKYHDLTTGDIDDDGELEVVGLSQGAETVFYYDVPDDPTVEPWPDDCLTVVDDGIRAEGALVADVNGDGRNELVAGTDVYYRPTDDAEWERQSLAEGWDDVRVAAADIDGDGALELVFSEGDSPTYGTHPGRVAWFDPTTGAHAILRDDLFCPHSLQVGDFTGNGAPDVYVAEMGLGENERARHVLFANRGDGTFEERTLAEGVPTHEAKAVDLTGDGRLDIVGKSYGPDCHVDVWYNDVGRGRVEESPPAVHDAPLPTAEAGRERPVRGVIASLTSQLPFQR